MDILQLIVQYIIIIEFALIILIILATYVLKYFFLAKEKYRDKQLFLLEQYFINILSEKISLHSHPLKSSWQRIEWLVPILNKLNAQYCSTAWRQLLRDFGHLTLLPLGREAAIKKNWVFRFYAAQAFALHHEKTDYTMITQLLKDPVPLVFYAALQPGLLTRSENCINAIILRLSVENWITKSLFLQAFKDIPITIRFFIEKCLMRSADPHIRATCYNALLEFDTGKIRWDITDDLHSKFINLKIASIKYLAHVKKQSSVPVLVDMLNHSEWEVKTICLHLLGALKATNAIAAIEKCLDDQDWWVRLAAAQALNQLGKEGKNILEHQDNKLHSNAFHVAQHVLNRL